MTVEEFTALHPAIPDARIRTIIREASAYTRVHLTHTRPEKRECGCDPPRMIGHWVPELDPELTERDRQMSGPLGFALSDGARIESGATFDGNWGAVRYENPEDRRSEITWILGAYGYAMRRVEQGWTAETDLQQASRLLAHRWADKSDDLQLHQATDVMGWVFVMVGPHDLPPDYRFTMQADGRLISDGRVSREEALGSAVDFLAEKIQLQERLMKQRS